VELGLRYVTSEAARREFALATYWGRGRSGPVQEKKYHGEAQYGDRECACAPSRVPIRQVAVSAKKEKFVKGFSSDATRLSTHSKECGMVVDSKEARFKKKRIKGTRGPH